MNANKKIVSAKYLLTVLLVLIALWPLPIIVYSQQIEYFFLFLLPGAWLYFIPSFTTFIIVFYCWWHVKGDRSLIYYLVLLGLAASLFYGCLAYAMMIEQSFTDVSLIGQIGFWSIWAYFLFGLILDYQNEMSKK